MLFPQEGWVRLCPSLSADNIRSTMKTLDSWTQGALPSNACLNLPLAGMRKPVLLRELMQVPMSAWQNLAGLILGKAVNARALAHDLETGVSSQCLELTGEDSLLKFSCLSVCMTCRLEEALARLKALGGSHVPEECHQW